MPGKPLTKRENEYVVFATSDLSFKEIGVLAGVTEETVKCALSIIYAKLGVRNRYGLIVNQLRKPTEEILADELVAEEATEDDPLDDRPFGMSND